jgi:DNA polymerase-3 subunit gamma/tau
MSGLFGDDDPPGAEDDLPAPAGPGLFGDSLAGVAAPAVLALPYRVLARKYRPVQFSDLIGQDAVVRTLRNAFALGRVAHAFMLTGVRGVGKTTTARIIARALNCVGPDGTGGPTTEPCGVCSNCVGILADRHPDVTEMDAASNNGIEAIREIIEAVRFRPMQARTRVFILDEVHMLSKAAFNALLKTLEEPPGHVKFIFATTEIRKVPVTVLSRCQRFDLRRISISELSAHYGAITAKEGKSIAPEALALIARAADGSARDGLSLLDQAIAQTPDGDVITAEAVVDMLGLADRSSVFELFEAVMAGKPAAALAITDNAHARGADLGELLGDLLDLVHTVTRLKSVPALREGADLPEAERVRGAALADSLTMASLGRAWQMLLKGIAEVEQAPDRRAAAEMVLIRLCYVGELPPPGDLVRRLIETPPAAGAAMQPAPAGNGGTRAVANGAPRMQAEPVIAVPHEQIARGPVLASFRDVAALVAERREPSLHAHLVHSVHLVRFAPPVIEIFAEPDAPRDLAARLSALLSEATDTRWTIALSSGPGAPTLAERGDAADHARRRDAEMHPLVMAILKAFPGAKIEAVRDSSVDGYGLSAAAVLVGTTLGGEGELALELPPPGSEDFDEPADFWENAP